MKDLQGLSEVVGRPQLPSVHEIVDDGKMQVLRVLMILRFIFIANREPVDLIEINRFHHPPNS